ncbi:LysR family transcriptional regulator [Fodinisporobacter ferrooxydans]|uniref:LysR family transcriptional regulator n=1 Tax=Fodinisporobacter ferrooxydans TaxID=2901836 RepID=A0ABY4CIH3_9BACL|nr:LysR family transcriptional regulator [Alicyclobacillaceae bacterium MYW30-H2]
MDIKYLETFLKVCDLGSFTAAADALNMSQPGVSKQIQRLQADLGVTLLRREENGIKLTEAGRKVYASGKTILAEWNALSDSCRNMGDTLSGLLRIGASTIPAKHLLPNVITNFHTTYPLVELSVYVADSKQVLEQLYRGSVEIACVGAKPEHPDVYSLQLASDRLVVIANRHKSPDRNWTDDPFILRETGSGTRIASEQALSSMGVMLDKVKCAAEVSDTGLMIRLVEAGMGLAIVSNLDVDSAVQEGRLSVIHEFPYQRHFYLACMRDASHHAVIQAFLQAAKTQF